MRKTQDKCESVKVVPKIEDEGEYVEVAHNIEQRQERAKLVQRQVGLFHFIHFY